MEGLEQRCVPATFTWNGSTSDDVQVAANWTSTGGGTPTSNDTAVITTGGQAPHLYANKSVSWGTLESSGAGRVFKVDAGADLVIAGVDGQTSTPYGLDFQLGTAAGGGNVSWGGSVDDEGTTYELQAGETGNSFVYVAGPSAIYDFNNASFDTKFSGATLYLQVDTGGKFNVYQGAGKDVYFDKGAQAVVADSTSTFSVANMSTAASGRVLVTNDTSNQSNIANSGVLNFNGSGSVTNYEFDLLINNVYKTEFYANAHVKYTGPGKTINGVLTGFLQTSTTAGGECRMLNGSEWEATTSGVNFQLNDGTLGAGLIVDNASGSSTATIKADFNFISGILDVGNNAGNYSTLNLLGNVSLVGNAVTSSTIFLNVSSTGSCDKIVCGDSGNAATYWFKLPATNQVTLDVAASGTINPSRTFDVLQVYSTNASSDFQDFSAFNLHGVTWTYHKWVGAGNPEKYEFKK